MTDDTFPPEESATEPEMVIPAGEAQMQMSHALTALALAFERVEQVGMACARALDQTKATP